MAVLGSSVRVTTDANGKFVIVALHAGRYVLRAEHDGYQPSESEPIEVGPKQTPQLTLALQAVTAASELKTIGRTTVSASEPLQRSSTISRTLDMESLTQNGTYRAGDALRELPGVNNGINGDTAALGDDLNLDLRGIGTLETRASLDGHPIALGVPGGYNFEVSPVFPFRNVTVTYGSGSNLSSESAIGGIVDFQTLEPTARRSLTVNQGYATWDALSTSVQATGTVARLGYALAFGVAGLDGPIRNAYMYQPGAAFDPSATDPSVRALAVYRDDSAAISRSSLIKFRYALSPQTQITFTSVLSSWFDDKTGNGDGDYLAYAPALAFGNQLLADYNPATSKFPPCPSGTFAATNANGHPNGTGPNGQPDGGILCETPAQYAAFNTGLQGAGPAYQTFNLSDYHVALDSATLNRYLRADVFTNRYLNIINRSGQLPFISVPDDAGRIRDYDVVETGATVMETFTGNNNNFALGYSYLNVAYGLATVPDNGPVALGAPVARETGFLLRDAYNPAGSRLAIYANANFMHATATNASYVDPRLSLVDSPSGHDVFRVSAGATTTQPAGNQLGQPFVPSSLGGAGGGATITCGGLNSIGNVPSSALRPERGVDEELAYAYRFFGDSQVQVGLYNVNVYDKLYSALIPLTTTGTSFIDPSYLAAATNTIAAKCGAQAAPALLGVNGTFNVGGLQARGFTLSGRLRPARRTFVDYDWTLDSAALVSAPVSLLQANQTLIIGSQLPHVPLHTLQAALDQTFGARIEARLTFHAVSANNTKNLPPYDYSDLALSGRFRTGVLTLAIDNLFDQYASIFGLQYEGVPLALNQYATPASYAPYTGADATERFGLPYRALSLTYAFHL